MCRPTIIAILPMYHDGNLKSFHILVLIEGNSDYTGEGEEKGSY